MSSQLEPTYDELAAELRAARPVAPEPLRARVLQLTPSAAPAPAPAPARRRFRRRASLVLVPALVVALAAGGALLDASRPEPRAETAAGGGSAPDAATSANTATTPALRAPARSRSSGAAAESSAAAQARRALSPVSPFAPPSTGRLQEYRADLRVRVDSLSELADATTQAMQITRSLRGYVVRADYGAPGDGDGDSSLAVRVPVGNVAAAVMRFSALGTVVGQRVSVQDLQAGLNRQTDQIQALRRTIATLERELRRDDLGDEARARLRARLANARTDLAARLNVREATERRGRLALVSLTLTTREGASVEPPAPPGRFEQTLRDAVHLVATLLVWLLAALIVAAPFLLLAALAVVLERRRRRYGADRLLERPQPGR